MAEFYAFSLAICAALTAAAASGSALARLGAGVISVNWALWSGWSIITGRYEDWQLGVSLDAASAFFLLSWRLRATALLAMIYCVQIAMNTAYGVQKWIGSPDYDTYYSALNTLFIAQLLVVGGWSSGGVRRRIHHIWRRGSLHSGPTRMDYLVNRGGVHAS